MDIRGIWKIKEIRMPTPEGLTVITPDNLPEDERFEECVQRMRCYTEFADDERRPSMELLCAKMAMLLLRAQLGKKKTENSTTTLRPRVNFWEKK